MANNLISKIRTDKGDCQIDYNALANRPSSLKNPCALTFTGEASSKYDGSTPVTVNIPTVPKWANQDSNPSYTKSESDNKYATKQDSDEKYAAADQTYTKDETDARYAPISAVIRPTVTGNPAVCKDSAAWAFQGLKIYGKSTQDGTPNPANPVPIVSAGDSGSIGVFLSVTNLCDQSNLKKGYWDNGSYGQSTSEIYRTAEVEIFKSGDYTWSFGQELTIVRNDNEQPNTNVSTYNVTYTVGKHYLSFRKQDNSDWGSGVKIMLNFGSVSKPWEPYRIVQTFQISTLSSLPGIPVESGGNYTDSEEQQWICNMIDFSSGQCVQNCQKVIFDGSDDENWSANQTTVSGKYRYIITPNPLGQIGTESSKTSLLLCNKFKTISAGSAGTYGAIPGISIGSSGVIQIYSDEVNSADVSLWETWLKSNPIEVVYPIETPSETPLSPEELAAYRALTTYDGTTVVSTPEDVSGLEVRYVADGTKYLQSVTDRIAALEAAQTQIDEV